MRHDSILDLADCTKFRQAMRAVAPRRVHSTVILLVLLLAAAVTWMSLTRARLVVRATGRVRPVSDTGVFVDDFSHEISSETGGLVAEVVVREGDAIRQGDVLLRLDTERLNNHIAKLRETIRSWEDEIQQLEQAEQLLAAEELTAQQRAAAEVQDARRDVTQARQKQASQIRLAELVLAEAEQNDKETRKAARSGAITRQGLLAAITRTGEAREKLQQARLPVDDGRIQVAAKAAKLIESEYQFKHKDLDIRRRTRQGKLKPARLELANLELDLTRSVARAPVDGVITQVKTRQGNLIEPGKVGMTIVPQQGLAMSVSVSNEDVGLLQIGMPTRVKLDAYDYQKYGVLQGTVQFIAPDSDLIVPGSTAAAKYRVRIELETDQIGRGIHQARVKLGMTGHAEIVTGQERIVTLLLRKMRQSVSLG